MTNAVPCDIGVFPIQFDTDELPPIAVSHNASCPASCKGVENRISCPCSCEDTRLNELLRESRKVRFPRSLCCNAPDITAVSFTGLVLDIPVCLSFHHSAVIETAVVGIGAAATK